MNLSGQKLQTASNIDSFIDVFIVNEKNENVFDPKYKGKHELNILILKGKKFVKFYAPNSYASEGYIVNSDYSIRIFLNLPPVNSNHSDTYIKYDDNKPIIIKTEFKITNPTPTNQAIFGGDSIIKDKIWFNSKLIWDSASDTIIPCIEITAFQ
jgi:hypothetical protein